MANKILNTRIQSKYDTYANWAAADPVLLAGEIAVVVVPAATGAVNQEPAILIKVGDGTKKFSELGWTSATAADVYDWAKASTKPTYAASEITGLGDAISTYVEDTMGITVDTNTVYKVEVSDDGKGVVLYSKAAADADTAWAVQNTVTLTGFVKQITEGATNGTISVDGTDVSVHGLGSAAYTDSTAYDAAGTGASEAATALTSAKAYADGLATNYDAAGAAAAVQTAINNTIGTVTTGKTVVQMIADAQDAATYDDSDLESRVKALEDDTTVETLVGNDTGKSVRTIANEELAAQLIPENADEALDTLKEIADWIQAHPGDASAMNTAIGALQGLVGDTAVATQIANAISALDLANTYDAKGAAAAAETNAKNYADGLASNYDAAGAATTAETNAKNYADGLASNYDASGAAAQALTDAKAYADGLASNYDAAGAAATAESNAKSYADGLVANSANWDKAQENVIEKITVNGTEVAPVNKTVALDIVTNVDDLEQTTGTYVTLYCGTATVNVDTGVDATDS